jgi:hypothetical protein
MSRQAFFHQASERTDNRFIIQGELILNDGMDGCVESSRRFGQRDSRVSMVSLDENQPYVFVKREPLGGVGGYFRIVAFHGSVDFVAANRTASEANKRHEALPLDSPRERIVGDTLRASSSDYFVGLKQDRLRDRQPERLCRLRY